MRNRQLFAVGLVAALLIAAGPAWVLAATTTFNDATANQNWFTAGNWTAGVPVSGGNVANIAAGKTANVSAAATVGTIVGAPNFQVSSTATVNILGGGSIAVDNNAYTAGTTRVLGTLNAGGNFSAGNTLFISYDTLGSAMYVTAGTVSAVDRVNVGFTSVGAANGLLDVSGTGVVTSLNLNVGVNAATGTLNVSGNGQITLTGALTVATNNTGVGNVTITGGQITAPTVGVGSGFAGPGTGTWTQSAGTLNVANLRVSLGTNPSGQGGDGTFNLSGTGTVNATTAVIVGDTSVALSGKKGQWNQTGGTLNVAGAANLTVGNASGSVGQFDISNGTINLGSGHFDVGLTGVGTVNQTGGKINIATGDLRMGVTNSATAVGAYNLSGGTLTTPTINMAIAGSGTGTFTLSGTGNLVLTTGTWTKKATSTVNFNGGTVNTGSGSINFDVVNNGTTFSPGMSVGVTNINSGNYTQNSGSIFIELAGNSSSQYDRLLVNTAGKSATFTGGTLQIGIILGYDAFQMAPGNTFDLVIADSVSTTLPTLVFLDPHFAGFLTRNTVSGGVVPTNFESVRLTLTMVPEPVSAAIVLLGGVGLLLVRRRGLVT